MEALIVGYYLGLFVFALNGLIWVAQRNERVAARARDDRLRRILMARKGKL